MAGNLLFGNFKDPEVIFVAHYDTYGMFSSIPKQNVNADESYYKFKKNLKAVISLFSIYFFLFLITFISVFVDLFAFLTLFISSAVILISLNKRNERFREKEYSAFDDNTSGIIALLEIQKDERFKNCLFIMTNFEELMGLGAMYYCFINKKFLKNKTVVNIDCIGRGHTLVNLMDENIFNGDQYHFYKYSKCVYSFQSLNLPNNQPYWIHSDLDNLIINDTLDKNINYIKEVSLNHIS